MRRRSENRERIRYSPDKLVRLSGAGNELIRLSVQHFLRYSKAQTIELINSLPALPQTASQSKPPRLPAARAGPPSIEEPKKGKGSALMLEEVTRSYDEVIERAFVVGRLMKGSDYFRSRLEGTLHRDIKGSVFNSVRVTESTVMARRSSAIEEPLSDARAYAFNPSLVNFSDYRRHTNVMVPIPKSAQRSSIKILVANAFRDGEFSLPNLAPVVQEPPAFRLSVPKSAFLRPSARRPSKVVRSSRQIRKTLEDEGDALKENFGPQATKGGDVVDPGDTEESGIARPTLYRSKLRGIASKPLQRKMALNLFAELDPPKSSVSNPPEIDPSLLTQSSNLVTADRSRKRVVYSKERRSLSSLPQANCQLEPLEKFPKCLVPDETYRAHAFNGYSSYWMDCIDRMLDAESVYDGEPGYNAILKQQMHIEEFAMIVSPFGEAPEYIDFMFLLSQVVVDIEFGHR